MKIAATQFNFNQRALEIYLSGCDGACGDKCHNQELWNFNVGDDWAEWIHKIETKLRGPEGIMIKNIWILGGEPTLHPQLIALLSWLDIITNSNIWLFTREERVNMDILSKVDYVKYGKYIESEIGENVQFGISLATTNQRIERGNRRVT